MKAKCERCGSDTKKYGTATCVECGANVCVEECIPGGNRTMCVQCEEQEPEEE
jgi:hypothetical protein